MSISIQKFQTLSSLLGSAGSIVSEKDQILAICNGLNGGYNSVMEIVQEGVISVQELTHKLLAL